MSEDRREAAADAKAAKARAKAMRPWYRKKRWWTLGLIGLIVLIVIIAAAAGGSKNSNTTASGGGSTGTSSGSTTTGVSTLSQNTQFPPPADVTVTDCPAPDAIGGVHVAGVILNHSPKTSNYIVQGTLVDSAGTHVGDWSAFENNVGPGQKANFSTDGIAQNPSGAVTCKVSSVDRTASTG
jgi:hypothetical protein